jgi:hypothetical protein
MTRSVARYSILLALNVLGPVPLASAGQLHPHESARSMESGGHHHAARPQPHATTAAPAMPGPSAAQVLSGPLPLFPAPPASPFGAATSTYVPHKGISPFLRPRPSIVIGGFGFGADAPSETASPAGRSDTPVTEIPVAAQPPEARAPDTHLPGAQTAGAASSAAPPLAPVTLYVIPGCYAGDRPPADGMLPAGCDVSKMRSVRIK